MARPHRLDPEQYIGLRLCFLTICTRDRARAFDSERAVDLVRSHFLKQATASGIELLAYCFMPDHLHLLTAPDSPSAGLQTFVKLAKQRSGFAFVRMTGRRLWQDSYYDRTIRDDQSPAAVMRYLIENPVRAGLVASVNEYPHWGSQGFTRDEMLDFIFSESRV